MTRFHVHFQRWLFVSFFCFVAIADVMAIGEVDMPMLPNDENEAHRMLAEGTLDSAVWRKVEQFYTSPLCVPRGDLRMLRDLFPGFSAVWSIDPSILSRYEPWNKKARLRFFADFPELLPFRPILSFERNQSHAPRGRVGYYYSRSGRNDTARQHASFFIGGSSVEGNGRIDFTDAYGRWYHRALTIVPLQRGKVICGNFTPERRERLFYGYFPPVPCSYSSAAENWRYGSSRSWNGLCAILTQGDRNRTVSAEGEAFIHVRPTERIDGLDATFAMSKHVSYSVGASLLKTIDSLGRIDNMRYIHSGVTLAIASSLKAELRSGVDVDRPKVVPWYFSWSHRSKRFNCDATLAALPKGFDAPRSEIGHLLRDRCAMDDTATKDLLAVELCFRHTGADFFIYEPRVRCIFSDDNIRYLSTALEVRGKGRTDYRISYCSSVSMQNGENGKILHRVLIEWSRNIAKTIELECIQNATFASDGYWRNRVMISSCFHIGTMLRFAPLFVVQCARNAPWEKRIGIQKTLFLFDKTFSEVVFEQSLPLFSLETLYVQGRMSFLF